MYPRAIPFRDLSFLSSELFPRSCLLIAQCVHSINCRECNLARLPVWICGSRGDSTHPWYLKTQACQCGHIPWTESLPLCQVYLTRALRITMLGILASGAESSWRTRS